MFVFAFASLLAMAKLTQSGDPAGLLPAEQIRIMPVPRTPEGNTVLLAINYPQNGEVVRNPVWVQFRLDGYPLGASSPGTRRDEIAVSKMGQTVHVVVDNDPYVAVNEPSIDPFNEDGYYFDTSFKFELPYNLSEGIHTLRMFPARSFGESLKGEHTYQVGYFYVGWSGGAPDTDLKGPYITYNEPSDQIPLRENLPVLLDFLVSNCELTPDGYKAVVTIDGNIKRTLTAWQPYYIYGLTRGQHSIRLQLIDVNGRVVNGSFNDTTRTIMVY